MEGYYVVFFFTIENTELSDQNDNFGSLDVVLVRGDAFIVKVSDVGHDLDGWAAYEDIPREFLSDESSALKETLINMIKKGAIGRLRVGQSRFTGFRTCRELSAHQTSVLFLLHV